jgi:hypothetical protein
MKDISRFKSVFCRAYAKKCPDCPTSNIDDCQKGDGCSCGLAAELKAYMHAIIPRGFHDFTIFNFDGTRDGKILLSRKEVKNIKEKISQYCWGMPFKNLKAREARNPLTPDRVSVMDKRRWRGDDVVIYGRNDRQIGRTMVSAIILREAIKRRFRQDANVVQTYDWIEYDNLINIATGDGFTEYQYCDWLVIDNIASESASSPARKRFLSSVINPFFTTRIDAGLPTILAFRFDISSNTDVAGADIPSMFGMGVERIIRDDNTATICLSEGEDG